MLNAFKHVSPGVIAGVALLALSSVASAAENSASPDARNFEGTWKRAVTGDASDFILGVDLPYKPEAQNLAADHLKWFKEGRSKASAHLTCRPTGVQGVTASKNDVLILQSADEIAMIFQEDREVRHVHLNQSHPQRLEPSYSGHSIGRWEGDTLVIDTIGYNGKGQLDEMGNPHSNRLHVVERWTKGKDGNTIDVEFTFTDPVYYTKPFTKTRELVRTSGGRIFDYDCGENPRSDDFENLTFENDWFRPTCVRPVKDGIAGEKVVCTTPASRSK